MKLSKLEKFEEFSNFPNSLEYTDADLSRQLEKWMSQYKKTILELGCGKGDYTLELARRNPNTLFIGVDIQGERLWRGAKTSLDEGIENARFLRAFIDRIDEILQTSSADEIWITFPDPFPKDKKIKKRLTYEAFLSKYHFILKKGGKLHLKTDDEDFFDFSIDEISSSKLFKIESSVKDIYKESIENIQNKDDVTTIQTTFEKKWLAKGRKINYLSAIRV